SIDGLYRIEGLKERFPIELEAPKYDTPHEGIVTTIIGISPEGTVRYISKSYGAYTNQQVIPKLGLITYSAIRKWRFDPLLPDQEQEDQEITVKIRYQHLK
ncbi:MAG: energy transducer TonB, partial [Bacteroidetes bacterium]|nr:energy transducer TonB [Bacteroidota bacterium]